MFKNISTDDLQAELKRRQEQEQETIQKAVDKINEYPKKCTKCNYVFKPGDKFYCSILNTQELNNRCEKCAKNFPFMVYKKIPEKKA